MKFVKAYICIACYYKMRKVREMKKAKKLLRRDIVLMHGDDVHVYGRHCR